MNSIELVSKIKLNIDRQLIIEDAQEWLKKRGCKNSKVEIFAVGKKRIKLLNKKFLSHDFATDVLSFPIETIPGEKQDEILLGTIFICYDIIESEAKKAGVPTEAEFIKLIRHGIDHLVGIHHE